MERSPKKLRRPSKRHFKQLVAKVAKVHKAAQYTLYKYLKRVLNTVPEGKKHPPKLVPPIMSFYDDYGIPSSTMSEFIRCMLDLLKDFPSEHITSTAAERKDAAENVLMEPYSKIRALLDGTHCPAETSSAQKDSHHSFKLKRGALTTLAATDFNDKIIYVSKESHPAGSHNDQKLLSIYIKDYKAVVGEDFTIADGAFVKDFKKNAFWVPIIKYKGRQLSLRQKASNKVHRHIRSAIERVFGRLKSTFKVLKLIWRLDHQLFNVAFRICAALYNLGLPQQSRKIQPPANHKLFVYEPTQTAIQQDTEATEHCNLTFEEFLALQTDGEVAERAPPATEQGNEDWEENSESLSIEDSEDAEHNDSVYSREYENDEFDEIPEMDPPSPVPSNANQRDKIIREILSDREKSEQFQLYRQLFLNFAEASKKLRDITEEARQRNFGNHTSDKKWQLAFSVMMKASKSLQEAERNNQFANLTAEDVEQVYHEVSRLLGTPITPPSSPTHSPSRKRAAPDDDSSDASGPTQSSAKKQKST